MDKKTQMVHAGKDPLAHEGAVNPPLYRTSTIIFPTLEAYHRAESGVSHYHFQEDIRTDYSYGITGTSTNHIFEKAMAQIEGGAYSLAFPSGLSAITTTLLSFLGPGDHALMVDSVYGPTRRFCEKELKRLGISISYYDPLIGKNIAQLIQENTRLIFLESPGSLTFEIQDVPAITTIARQHRIVTVLDNSWASPLYFQAFAKGVDVVIQAATKYIAGHSDILLGTVTTTTREYFQTIFQSFRHFGIHTAPENCYLALRGLKTMAVRIKQHEQSALTIARWLEKHSKINRVLHPALSSHPQYALWKRDFLGSTGLFSILLDKKYPRSTLAKMIDPMRLFSIGCSWGGFESLILDMDSSIFRTATPWQEPYSCIRLFIGLEDTDDLIADLNAALLRLDD